MKIGLEEKDTSNKNNNEGDILDRMEREVIAKMELTTPSFNNVGNNKFKADVIIGNIAKEIFASSELTKEYKEQCKISHGLLHSGDFTLQNFRNSVITASSWSAIVSAVQIWQVFEGVNDWRAKAIVSLFSVINYGVSVLSNMKDDELTFNNIVGKIVSDKQMYNFLVDKEAKCKHVELWDEKHQRMFREYFESVLEI